MLPLGREAVRVRVLKYDCKLPPDVRKFSVDPQITSLEELRSIITTAFEIKDDFSLSYKSSEGPSRDEYVALISDWDLDTAFMKAQNASCLSGSEPCINLRVDIRLILNGSLKEINKVDQNMTKQQNHPQKSNSEQMNELKQLQLGFQGMLMNHMEKTLNLVSRALNLSDDSDTPPRPPLSQSEFLSFLGPVGHVIHGEKLREVIYNGGVEPTFRKVAWKHILNVYPEGMSGKERLDYMKRKSAEYYSLRDVWRDCLQRGPVSADLTYVTNMVRKDVLRTDRHHKFYSGSDDNQNIMILFNILTTYAVNHPTVSYCQGMSDLASPLLVVMENEAHAYICLCALMIRLQPNFLLDGEAMTLKFSHLSESLQIYDPIFYAYLQTQQADDLLFCYRWLLLEMKREFAFDDALHMLEVLWSSMPSKPPKVELCLKEKEFSPEVLPNTSEPTPNSPLYKTARENAYSKLCAIRRQSSSYNFASSPKGKQFYKRMNLSLDENIGKGNVSIQMCKEFQSLDETLATCDENYSVNLNNDLSVKSPESNTFDMNTFNPEQCLKSNLVSKNSSKLAQYKIEEERSKNSIISQYFSSLSEDNQNDEGDSEKENLNVMKIPLDVNQHDIKTVSTSWECPNSHITNGEIQYKEENFKRTYPESDTCSEIKPNDNIPIKESSSNDNSDSDANKLVQKTNPICTKSIKSTLVNEKSSSRPAEKSNDDVFVWENPLHDNNLEIKKTIFLPDTLNECSSKEDAALLKLNSPSEPSKADSKPMRSREALKSNSKFFSSMSQELENARKNCEILLSNKHSANLQNIASTISNFQKKYENQTQMSNSVSEINYVTNSCEEINEQNGAKALALLLPAAEIFGGGNPFLIFLSLTLLLQHRDYIMRNQMDYNELAMYFDKMVRKHNVNRVLNQARQMYSSYLKEQTK